MQAKPVLTDELVVLEYEAYIEPRRNSRLAHAREIVANNNNETVALWLANAWADLDLALEHPAAAAEFFAE